MKNRKEIDSINNNRIKDYRKLLDRKYRKRESSFIIEGLRICDEALRQGADIECIIFDKNKIASFEDLITKAQDRNIEIIESSSEVINSLTETENPQGIVSIVKLHKNDKDIEKGRYIFLDRIQDPGNLGTILRSAHAFNMDGVILSKGCTDPYSEKVIRSTMGSIFKVNLYTDFESHDLDILINKGFSLFVTEVKDAKELKSVEFSENFIFVIGNEANGVSDEILLKNHQSVIIPMPGGAESLNAAVASSIVMYEINR